MSNWYASLSALRTRLGLDATDDVMLTAILESVSRSIDAWTGRHFYAQLATRTLSTPRPDRLLVPDLLAVTTLKTDSSGDLSYATTWDPTDYVLTPSDAPLMSPPHPYWEVRTAPGGAQAFGSSLHNVQIAGQWGYYEVLVDVGATLDNPLPASATTTTVQVGTDLERGHTIHIDDEQLFIRDVSGNLLTLLRGVNGTTATAHLADAPVILVTYPVVTEACLLQAGHLYQSTQAPGGIVGGSDFGPLRFAAFQPLVRMMLQPFKLPGLARYGD